jgi:hypothetical protein
MLLDMEFGGSFVASVWYPDFFNHVRRSIEPSDFDDLWLHVNDRFVDCEVLTTSWEPGRDWARTPFRVICPAVGFYPEEAAKFVGLIYCAVAIERPELWGCHHAELNGIPIRGRTYYRLNR